MNNIQLPVFTFLLGVLTPILISYIVDKKEKRDRRPVLGVIKSDGYIKTKLKKLKVKEDVGKRRRDH